MLDISKLLYAAAGYGKEGPDEGYRMMKSLYFRGSLRGVVKTD